MFENLTAPVDAWIVLVLFALFALQLSYKVDKPKTRFKKKDNLKALLENRVYKLPRQDSFDLALFGEPIMQAFVTASEKLNRAGDLDIAWATFSVEEQEAYILGQFKYIQQFLNSINEHFIAERTTRTVGWLAGYDMPYSAICLTLYRGEESIGEIEIEDRPFSDNPEAIIRCRLKYADMFDHATVISLFRKVASIHFDQNDLSIQNSLEAKIDAEISNYSWDRLHSNACAKYDGGHVWHELEPLEMSFTGQFQAIQNFNFRIAKAEGWDIYESERKRIQSYMNDLGYEQIK